MGDQEPGNEKLIASTLAWKFTLIIASLPGSIGTQFLKENINRAGALETMQMIERLLVISKERPLQFTDLTTSERACYDAAINNYERTDGTMTRRGLGRLAVALTAGYLTADGLKHMDKSWRGFDELSWKEIKKKSDEGHDMLRGPAEVGTAITLLLLELGMKEEEILNEQDKISALANTLSSIKSIGQGRNGRLTR